MNAIQSNFLSGIKLDNVELLLWKRVVKSTSCHSSLEKQHVTFLKLVAAWSLLVINLVCALRFKVNQPHVPMFPRFEMFSVQVQGINFRYKLYVVPN